MRQVLICCASLGLAAFSLLGTIEKVGFAMTPAAAAKPAEANQAAAKPTMEGQWKAVKLAGEAIPDGVEAPTLSVAADGKVSGSTAVNRYSGALAKEGGKLFGPLATTRRAGPPAAMKVETAFTKALGEATRFTVENDSLTLLAGDEARVVLTRVP